MNALKRHLPTVSRVLLGLVFLIFGLNGFFHFLPQPPMSPQVQAFAGGLMQSGYFFPMLKGIEIAAAVLLLTGVLVPFTLTVLAPIVVNIVAFHLFLAPAGMPIALLVLALELHLAWVYRATFAPLFARTAPAPLRAQAPAETPRAAAAA